MEIEHIPPKKAELTFQSRREMQDFYGVKFRNIPWRLEQTLAYFGLMYDIPRHKEEYPHRTGINEAELLERAKKLGEYSLHGKDIGRAMNGQRLVRNINNYVEDRIRDRIAE